MRVEIDIGVQRLVFGGGGVDAQAEGAGGLQRVDDVQIMRPGLGEILPGMGGGIGGNEILLPVRRRAFGVMALQGCGVILPLIAEHRAAGSSRPVSRTSRSQK